MLKVRLNLLTERIVLFCWSLVHTCSYIQNVYILEVSNSRLARGQSANTMPLWKREGSGEDLYLYSGLDGKWHVTWQHKAIDDLQWP